MQRRFFIEHPITEAEVRISGADAHHIRNVNRLDVGDTVTLFDGSGKEFEANIVAAEKRQISLSIVQALEISREIDGELTLAVALPKGDRQKILVEKMVELGVTTLIPFTSERSVVRKNEKSLDRLNRWGIEAAKQCGRNLLMKVEAVSKFEDLLKNSDLEAARFFAHPYGTALSAPQAVDALGPMPKVLVAIGPEGGFSDLEVAAAKEAGWKGLRLGRSILRVGTAAAATATLFGLGR